MADFEELVKGCHRRKIKVVYAARHLVARAYSSQPFPFVLRSMDLVANHTSHEHEWFTKSRASKGNPKRDWYISRPPRYDEEGKRHPPNDWRAHFQGTVLSDLVAVAGIQLNAHIGAFRARLGVGQPDLNWENGDLRQGVYDIVRFWVDKGVDGFRPLDVINKISKARGLPDAPILLPEEEYQWGHCHYVEGYALSLILMLIDPALNGRDPRPRVHEFVKEMHDRVLSSNDLITIGETPQTLDPSAIAAYIFPQNKELNMIFHFELIDIDSPHGIRKAGLPLVYERPRLRELKEVIGKWQTYVREEGFWNTIYIENHDRGRSVSRSGDDSDEWRTMSAKLLAILQVMQSGTLFLYQGEELGLRNFPATWGIEEYKNVHTRNYHKKVLDERRTLASDGEVVIDMSEVLEGLAKKARDHARTPMQWANSANAGFSTGTPWMRVNEDYEDWNVADQEQDLPSVLVFWRAALAMRKKQHDVLIYGDFLDLLPDHENLFIFKRKLGDVSALVMLNFAVEEESYELGVAESEHDSYDFLLGNYPGEVGCVHKTF
ncbi:glycoside hydrolase superfamily [Pterulicium gracile]|uniref:Glycoside hydrolase superfamily n=1 Tax=Pterulicium gracile TaxID=1884261 RepID=A0A5C3QCX3_9AGAR|nr:glycoside hydrolase superfamily [Pterula gracilis]